MIDDREIMEERKNKSKIECRVEKVAIKSIEMYLKVFYTFQTYVSLSEFSMRVFFMLRGHIYS